MKKSLLLSLFSLLAMGGFSQQTSLWVSQSTGFIPVASGVRNISVVDTNTVWITAYDGNPNTSGLPRQDYSRTIDGGQTWHMGTVPTTTSFEWSMLYALSDSTAWAVFFNSVFLHSGQVWKTTNAGANWTQQGVGSIYTSTTESFPNSIYFWNDTDGVVIGDPITIGSRQVFEIYTSSNGGTTWTLSDTTNLSAIDADEANIVTHYIAVGDTIWFDTNFGRVFRSIDHGHTWTVSSTNLTNYRAVIDLAFFNHLGGIARYYNDTLFQNTVVETSDGGNTWTPFTLNGTMFGGDIKAVPGVDSMLVSTSASLDTANSGTSYSLNGGHNWTVIETGIQRGNLGIADSLTMWCGGFTNINPNREGIYKWETLNIVSCGDANINSGTLTIDTNALCHNDTATLSTTGIYSPLNGDFFGFAYAISTADISGSLDPNNELSYIGSTQIIKPAPTSDTNLEINDGTTFGNAVPFGVYYFTPVVFANATAAASNPQRLFDLNLDPNCTFTGTSVALNFQDWGIPPCSPVGINELYTKMLSISSSLKDRNTLDVLINSANTGKVNLQIMDLTGRTVKTLDASVKEGSNHEYINIANLAQGTYMVNAKMNGVKSTSKVIVY